MAEIVSAEENREMPMGTLMNHPAISSLRKGIVAKMTFFLRKYPMTFEVLEGVAGEDLRGLTPPVVRVVGPVPYDVAVVAAKPEPRQQDVGGGFGDRLGAAGLGMGFARRNQVASKGSSSSNSKQRKRRASDSGNQAAKRLAVAGEHAAAERAMSDEQKESLRADLLTRIKDLLREKVVMNLKEIGEDPIVKELRPGIVSKMKQFLCSHPEAVELEEISEDGKNPFFLVKLVPEES